MNIVVGRIEKNRTEMKKIFTFQLFNILFNILKVFLKIFIYTYFIYTCFIFNFHWKKQNKIYLNTIL